MGSIRSHCVGFHTNPPLPPDIQFDFNISHVPLMLSGFNFPVIVSTATAYQIPSNPQSVKIAQVNAHFDTGASVTCIDIELAKFLNLIPVGETPSNTAAGMRMATNFVVDLSFPGGSLRPFRNLSISSCDLGGSSKPLKFSVLLGRDLMSCWTIVWDGPSSTVIIND